MAMYRTVSMAFWTDPKVIDEFTPEDRYFYLYLFTNPHTNLAGCYEISMKQMADELGYSKETIEKLIARFKDVHKVIDYDSSTKEILLINWHKYNWTSSEKFRKPLLAQIQNIKSEKLKLFLIDLYNGIERRYGIGTIYPIDTTVTNTNTITNTISNKENDIVDIWINYKRNTAWTTTQELEMARKVIADKINQYGEQAVKMCVEQSIANGYKGIVWDYNEKPKKKGQITGRSYSSEDYKSMEEKLLQRS